MSLGIDDTREDYLKKPYPTSTPEQLMQAWRSMYAYRAEIGRASCRERV